MIDYGLRQKNVAKFFGVSLTTIQNWRRKGCPIRDDGMMEILDVLTWRSERAVEAKDRKLLGQLVALGEAYNLWVHTNEIIESSDSVVWSQANFDGVSPHQAATLATDHMVHLCDYVDGELGFDFVWRVPYWAEHVHDGDRWEQETWPKVRERFEKAAA